MYQLITGNNDILGPMMTSSGLEKAISSDWFCDTTITACEAGLAASLLYNSRILCVFVCLFVCVCAIGGRAWGGFIV